jgi:hypothetical protein
MAVYKILVIFPRKYFSSFCVNINNLIRSHCCIPFGLDILLCLLILFCIRNFMTFVAVVTGSHARCR